MASAAISDGDKTGPWSTPQPGVTVGSQQWANSDLPNGKEAAASFQGSAWGHDQRPGADLSWRNTGARASSTQGRGAAAGQGTRRGARTPRQGTDRLVGWVALGLHLTPDHRGHRRGDPRLPGNLHDPVGARLVDVAVLLAVE